jgi:hypothetical protein
MKKFSLMAFLLLSAWFSVNNSLVDTYVATLKGNALTVGKQEDPLYQSIVKNASTYEIPPSNAKIDEVWKAIPGYNGITVDIEASYKNMKKIGTFNEKKLVYKQTEPSVHLNDLTPSPIYRGHPDKPMVSFIINVAW